MHFTPAIAAAILAFASQAMATPMWNGTQPDPSCDSPTPTPDPTPTNGDGLSLTQKVFLADTAADRYALLSDDDFVFDFNQPQANPGAGGEIVAANRKNMPALVGTSASMALGRVGPCGLNTFHVHPRSAELQIVTAGKLITEMVPENGVLAADGKTRRVIRTELTAGMMTVFPQGSVHTQFNPDCENATFVAAFASEDAGAGQIADETFAFSDDLILGALGASINGEDIDRIRAAIPRSIAQGVDQCLEYCNIPKNQY